MRLLQHQRQLHFIPRLQRDVGICYFRRHAGDGTEMLDGSSLGEVMSEATVLLAQRSIQAAMM
jgi:hypothetical protein